MAPEDDPNMKVLNEVRSRKEDSFCADCGKPDPEWASYTFGVFLCLNCASLHCNLCKFGKVKSVTADCCEESLVQFLSQHGNAKAKAKYEAYVPAYYYRPVHNDCLVLKEQWMRAKYERKEFTEPGKYLPYDNGLKEGFLWKRGRDSEQYFPRRFLLSEREGSLKYFVKEDAKEPKMVIKIDTINVTFQPEKTGHPNGLQITYLKDNKTRNIFLYHETGKEIVDWFNAIRAVQFHYLKVAFPVASDEELRGRLTRNFLKEGYMEKTGPKSCHVCSIQQACLESETGINTSYKCISWDTQMPGYACQQREAFKKRWFTLDHRRLMYFKDPLDAFAKGEVFVGSEEQGYSIMQGLPPGTQGSSSWQYGITIVTPDRNYLFTCETEREQQEWIAAFKHVIDQPMTPQEYAVEAYFRLKP